MNRKNKKIVMFDGQRLDRTQHKFLYQYHSECDADIFELYNGNLILKYVGYIEIIVEDYVYQLYCFPKEYVTNDNIREYTDVSEYTNEQLERLYEEFNIVLKSIFKATDSGKGFGLNSEDMFFASPIYYLSEIISHYNQYGMLVENEKEQKSSNTGKINWNKTIGKVIPKYSNGNVIYDRFVVEKKNTNITFLSMLIAKVILEGTTKYHFYMPIIDTGLNYDEILKISDEVAINLLYELKNKTFKDYLHQVIDNLINYLKDYQVEDSKGILLGTNNYHVVWERIVGYSLGSKFTNKVKYSVGKQQTFNKNKSNINIELDHLSTELNIIADSKYYNDRDEEKLDYKQLYYNYQMIYDDYTKKSNEVYYSQILNSHSEWVNVLIKPSKETEGSFSIIELQDNMKLFSLKINTKLYITDFVLDNVPTVGFEVNEQFRLVKEIEKLKEEKIEI